MPTLILNGSKKRGAYRELYVGGDFNSVSNNIVKWDGTNWSAVGSGTNGEVTSFSIYNGDLYVGGVFDSAGGVFTNHIAKWNGINWSSIGAGLGGTGSPVWALSVYNGELYASGNFSIQYGDPFNFIAKWNGTAWDSVGIGINFRVFSLLDYSGYLYAGGDFDSAGGNPANRIAKWDGTTWSALGTGINGTSYPTVYALSGYNSELYAGGYFTNAGSTSANNIAKWNSVISTAIENISPFNSAYIYPNPSTSKITIESNTPNNKYELYDIAGKFLLRNFSASNKFEIDLSHYSAGMYFLTIGEKEKQIHRKFVKE